VKIRLIHPLPVLYISFLNGSKGSLSFFCPCLYFVIILTGIDNVANEFLKCGADKVCDKVLKVMKIFDKGKVTSDSRKTIVKPVF